MAVTLLDLLAQKLPSSSRTTLRRMLQSGRVLLNNQLIQSATHPVRPTDRIEILDRAAKPRPKTDLDIVYEDADLLVVNKPPGLLTSTNAGEQRPTLLAQTRAYLAGTDRNARAGLIHRLDKDAAGLLVFSKNNQAYHSLKSQFFNHSVTRIYHAIILGHLQPPAGTIRTQLVETTTGKVHSTKLSNKGQVAITHYETAASSKHRSLLRLTLETGRKHQIRVHLSEINHPVLGDTMYGPANTKCPRLMLIATQLTVAHPRTEKQLTWKLDLPADMQVVAP